MEHDQSDRSERLNAKIVLIVTRHSFNHHTSKGRSSRVVEIELVLIPVTFWIWLFTGQVFVSSDDQALQS